jgi:hypothetical protein
VGFTEILPRVGLRWYSRAASRNALSAGDRAVDKGVMVVSKFEGVSLTYSIGRALA